MGDRVSTLNQDGRRRAVPYAALFAILFGRSCGVADNINATGASSHNLANACPNSATTCVGTTPNGALLAYDNEGRLTACPHIENVTTSPASTPAMEKALYDGEGSGSSSSMRATPSTRLEPAPYAHHCLLNTDGVADTASPPSADTGRASYG